MIFQFLYINVLNYCYFYTDSWTFFKNKKRWKNKKTLKTRFYRKIKKTFINVYYNYENKSPWIKLISDVITTKRTIYRAYMKPNSSRSTHQGQLVTKMWLWRVDWHPSDTAQFSCILVGLTKSFADPVFSCDAQWNKKKHSQSVDIHQTAILNFWREADFVAKLWLSYCQIWWRIWRYLKPQPTYYKWKILSTAILTLTFDLDSSRN